MSLRFFSLSSTIRTNSCDIDVLSIDRKCEREGAPLAEHAFDPDVPAMQLDKFLGKCQPETGSFPFLGGIGPHLPELFKYRLLMFGSDADARVADRYLYGIRAQRSINVDAPPSGVNFTALDRRLSRICLNFLSSPTASPNCSSM